MPATTGQQRRVDASMSLLVDIETSALDPAYAEASRGKRGEGGGGALRRRASGGTVALLLVITGLLVATTVVQARLRAPAAERTRSALERDIRRESDQVDALSRELEQLRTSTTRARNDALTATTTGAALAAQLDRLEAAVGETPVAGAGLRVRLDDAPEPQQNPVAGDQPADTSRILDRDVQDVVNELWSGGAQAIAVNGIRLSAQTAIRSAGQAVLVDFQPLSPPYEVTAIGDPVALDTSFGASQTASRLRTYAQAYGIRFSYKRVSKASVPAAGSTSLRYATADQGKGSS